jgi:hypothetical protein
MILSREQIPYTGGRGDEADDVWQKAAAGKKPEAFDAKSGREYAGHRFYDHFQI